MTPNPSLRALATRALLAFAMVASMPAAALAAQLRGEVVATADGDTFTLLTTERQQVRVRLAVMPGGIDIAGKNCLHEADFPTLRRA